MSNKSRIPEYCKAITYTRRGDPRDVVTFEDNHLIPKIIPKGQMLVKTKAVAVNPVDLKFMKNLFSFSKKVIGSDFSGTIINLDPSITNFKIGDKIYGSIDRREKFRSGQGSFCEFILVNPTFCSKIPPSLGNTNISFEDYSGCSIVGLNAVGMSRLTKDLPSEKQTRILVCGGSSAIGLMLIPILKYKGFTVVSTCSKVKFDIVKERGADKTVDYKSKEFQENLISESEKEGKFDLILDCVESYEVWIVSPKILKKDSIYANVGIDFSRGKIATLFRHLSYSFLPVIFGGIPSKYKHITSLPDQELFDELNEYLIKGIVKPIIDSTFPWENAIEALERSATNKTTGKVIITMPSNK